MGDLEVILGLLWVILVRSWALLVLSWCSFGVSWLFSVYIPWYRPPFLICVPWYWPPCAAVSRSGCFAAGTSWRWRGSGLGGSTREGFGSALNVCTRRALVHAPSWGPLGKRKLYVPWYRPPFLICVPWYWPPCAAVSRSGHPGGQSCIHGKRSREAPLGPTWDHGVPWGSLGALPGALLGSLGSLLGAPWSPLRVPWVSLGGFVKLLWGPLEPS